MLGVATLLLVACGNDHAYEYSVDVNSSEWTPADTLFYPIHVDQKVTPYSPIECHYPYCLTLVVRYERSYPAPVIPLCILLDKEYSIKLDLGDEIAKPDGETWGSLYTKEFDVSRALFSFPDSGDYVLKIWPEKNVETVLSITAILE